MFQYDKAILERFPRTVGGITLAQGLKSGISPEALQKAYRDEQKAVIASIGDTPLSELATLSAWRSTFSAFGVNPTKTRSAPEALLRRLTKKGDIPSINTLVDIGNLVSIRYGLPVAVFDTRSLTGMLTVQFAKGDERYTELGSNEVKHPEKGEVIFADETGLVFARRWCWRQSFQSAAKIDTTHAIITIEAQHIDAYADVEKAQSDLLELLGDYARGEFESGVLSVEKATF